MIPFRIEIGVGLFSGNSTYVENLQCTSPTRFGVLLAQGNQLLGQALGLFGLGPCRGD